MESSKVVSFQSMKEKVGRFDLREKTFLIPQMNRIGGHLLAGTFRGFGVRARVMDTFKGMDLGKEYTSGKECYPCQITTGDILHCMKEEREKLGEDFDPDRYVYFMPESGGPCRFGMYNKYQRIVLDGLPDLDRVKIGALTTGDGYSLAGLIDDESVGPLRKAAYFSVVVADILDRLLWRIRPYEREPGMADEFIERSMHELSDRFEAHSGEGDFDRVLEHMEMVIEGGKALMDPAIAPKPLIGMVG